MKNLLLVFAFSLALVLGCNEKKVDENSVPSPVVTSFNQKYPGAQVNKWEMETKDGKTIYEAHFKINDSKKEAEFFADGSFRKEE